MITKVPMDLTDEELSLIADFIDGHKTKRKATRKEVISVSTQLLKALVKAQVRAVKSVESGVVTVGRVIHDINKGGWSLLDGD